MVTVEKLCFCVPGESSIIDLVGGDGRSAVYGKNLDEIRQQYPLAEVRDLDEFCAEKAKAQDTPITWTETTEERYYNMLEVLPPAAMARGGFLVGEPWDHHAMTGRPRFSAFLSIGERFFEASRPMTEAEFRDSGLPMPNTNCTCDLNIANGQPFPNYCPEHDGDYSSWLVNNNID